MKKRLSFCDITFLSDNIIEVVIDSDIEVSLEMVEEFDAFLDANFTESIGLLVNKLNHYSVEFGAKMTLGSHESIIAIAVVSYSANSTLTSMDIKESRRVDNLNINIFSGLELGWQQAKSWLEEELETVKSQ